METRLRRIVSRRPRLTGFSLLAAGLLALVYYLSPAQMPIVMYKFAIVTLSGVIGYWLDRHAFPGEIHKFLAAAQTDARCFQLVAAAFIRRAILMGASMIAAGVAL